jgi:hypothetical protein
LSEKTGHSSGIVLKREFKVHHHGIDPEDNTKYKVHIREDIVKAPEAGKGTAPVMTENEVTVTVSIVHK